MISEYLFKRVLDLALNRAKKILLESGLNLLSTRDDVEQSLNHHLRSVKNWSEEISFSDLKRAKRTTSVFIELRLFVYPRRVRIASEENIETIQLHEIFEKTQDHLVLLGQPGAGKTTSMKFLCQLLLHSEEFQKDRFSFPILIILRNLNEREAKSDSSIIIDYLYDLLGLKLNFPKEASMTAALTGVNALKEKLVVAFLEEIGVLLVLDGFDELTQFERRERALREIKTLAGLLDKSRIIVTSRTGDFNYSIDKAAQYELCPLREGQIAEFASKWLDDPNMARDFLAKVRDSPFADTAIKPLTLAHLCAIYERIGKIPDKPRTLYRKIINLLLEEWDQQRSVKRESRYAQFEVDRKFEFLCHLAYVLTTLLQKTSFSQHDLLLAYNQIFRDYDLAITEARQIVNELETHTGLILQSGYEEFEFAHKSLQEFLTAEHLVKLPSIPNPQEIVAKLPNELAIAVTISSKPSDYFSELVVNRLARQKVAPQFVSSFVTRLLLEKPDFNQSVEFALTVVILYSIYIESSVAGWSSSDPLLSQFESLLDLALRRSSSEILKAYYELDYVYEMGTGDNVVRLIKRRHVQEHGFLFVFTPLDMPQTIHIRSSFLEGLMPTTD